MKSAWNYDVWNGISRMEFLKLMICSAKLMASLGANVQIGTLQTKAFQFKNRSAINFEQIEIFLWSNYDCNF